MSDKYVVLLSDRGEGVLVEGNEIYRLFYQRKKSMTEVLGLNL